MDRFWSKVDRKGPDDCWEWRGYCLKGHGRFLYDGYVQYAHRVSWTLCVGEIPDEKCVLHKCNNKPCVNPSHLYIGDYQDNAIDRSKAGTNPKMKMSADDVRLMRELFGMGTHYKALMWLFGVAESSVHRICNRTTYKWVT